MSSKTEGEGKRSAHVSGATRFAIPPELHFQTSKKIAQLTKVIYTLNVRLDEQECALEAQREANEERFQHLLAETRAKIQHYRAKASSATELQQRVSSLEAELSEEKQLRSAAECEAAKLLKLSAASEDAQCWQRLLSRLRSGGAPLNTDLDAIWNLLKGGDKGARPQVVADIPEKDCDATTSPTGTSTENPTTQPREQNCTSQQQQDQWRCPSCGGSSAGQGPDTADQEEELLERLAENERMTERLQQEIGNLEKSLATKDQEMFQLQKKVCSQKSCAAVQTDLAPDEMQEKPKCKSSEGVASSLLGDELRQTLAGFQSVAKDLRETKESLVNWQNIVKEVDVEETAKLSREGGSKSDITEKDRDPVPNNNTEADSASTTRASETECPDLGEHPHTAMETKEAQTEFKTKVAQLLQQVTLLMTAPELSSCNMSDAEKECAELRRRLREVHEQHKNTLAQKEQDYKEKLDTALAEKEAQRQLQEQEQHSEFENTLKHLEEKWQQENCTGEQDHALIAKLECELCECKQLLKSQTELQTTEMSRMSRELESALKALKAKEEELSARECALMKDLEEERSRDRVLIQQLQQSQRQAESFSRQLDLKRDELIQLRKEAMQQIRNLENYWLEKVNKELERVKKSYSEEKKGMLDNFCKAQRLLKDKILVLQAAKVAPPQTHAAAGTLDRSESAPHLPKARRGSVMSQIEYCIHEEDNESGSIDEIPERICSSQPNVAKLKDPPPTLALKKDRFIQNQRFIKRAESVLLPKLQFLSFWKSASSIDKDNHAKQQQQQQQQQHPKSRPRCNSTGVPLFAPPPAAARISTNIRKRTKVPSGLPPNSLKCPLLFQESRSSSCCNLASCPQAGLRETSPRRSLAKTRDYYNKRHSVGAKFWIGPLAETGGDCEDTDSESSDSECDGKKVNKKKEPLLESEL